MSSFTGVSLITDGKHCTTSAVDVDTDSGYHLLMVKDYSRTVQEIPNGQEIISGPFMVGGHKWHICFYPNGEDPSCADFVSLSIVLGDVDIENPVKVHCEFSFVDEVEYQKPIQIRATETRTFSSGLRGWALKFTKRDTLERSTHLRADCFTIRCDIVVCNTQEAGGTVSDVHQHFDHLRQNKVGADVMFEVNGKTFAAHRCVLAARSKVFMAQFFGSMMESTTSSVIQIKDMEAIVFEALLSFIYTDSFPEMGKDNSMEGDQAEVVEQGQEEEEVHYVMWLQDLFVAADRYDLQRLKILCEEHLSEYIDVSSVASTLALAEQHNCCGLKEACLKFIQVQSLPCLEKVMATEGWEHIRMTYPSVLKEFVAKVASNQKDKKRRPETM